MKEITGEQKRAIETLEGIVCVRAGAGTGKTTVLVERFLRIFSSLKAEGMEDGRAVESILAVTFTNKAAGEMRGRLEAEFNKLSRDNCRVLMNKLYVSTIDSFCNRILRENALELGINPEFRILDEVEEKLLFIRVCGRTFNYKGLPQVMVDKSIDSFIEDLYRYIIQLRNNAISSRGFLLMQEKAKEENRELCRLISKIYSLYEQEMKDKNLFNFSGLLLETLKMLTEKEAIKEKYRKQFRYVLVDEYQDTTPLQHKLLRMFSDNYFIVGDVKQSIYGFRGAKPENLESFDGENSVVIRLTENFRSCNEVLEVVNKVSGRAMKEYEPINSKKRGGGGCCEIFPAETREAEAEFIARRIIELRRDEEVDKLSEIAILLRSVKTPVSIFENALRKYGIPFITSGGRGYFERPEIRDIVALLSVINNPFDDLSLVRVLRSPLYRIKNSTLAELTVLNIKEEYDEEEKRVLRRHSPLFDALSGLDEIKIEGDVKSVLEDAGLFINDFLFRKRASSLSLLVYRVITESNYLHYCHSLLPGERKRSLANIKKLYALVQKFEERNVFSTLADFIAYLKEVTGQESVESEARLSEENAVHIMSIHKAKGLEFPVVFVADIRDRAFPSGGKSEVYSYSPEEVIKQKDTRKGRGGSEVNPEEMRLLYVAMTRAERKLILSGSLAGNRKMSRFLEMFVDKDKKLLPEFVDLIVDRRKGFRKDDEEWKGRHYLQPEEEKLQPVSARQVEENLFTTYKPPVLPGVSPGHFSVSELVMYERCPLRYKYRYVFNLPFETEAEAAPGEGPLMEGYTFGSIIHMVLEEYMSDLKENIKWDDKRVKDRFCELAGAYGKTGKESEEAYGGEAKDLLKNFINNKNNKPENVVLLEQPFSLFIDGWEVRGTIDRIDATGDGYRIIDYKTGSKKKEKFQLAVYKWGAEKLLGCNPVKKLSLWFLRSNELVDLDISSDEEKDIEEKIKGIIKKVKNREFKPAESESACKFCEYTQVCRKKGRTSL